MDYLSGLLRKGTTHALVRCLCIKICNACTLYDKNKALPQCVIGKKFRSFSIIKAFLE